MTLYPAATVVEVDGTEIHDHAWLAPPTFVTLTMLAEHDSVAGLLAAPRAASPERFRTLIGDSDGTVTSRRSGTATSPTSTRAWRYERD